MSLSDIWERTINNAVYGDCRRHGSDQGPVTTHIHQNSTENHTSINGCCYCCDQPDQPHCSLNSTEHQHGRLLFTTVETNPLQFKGEAFPQQRSARSVCCFSSSYCPYLRVESWCQGALLIQLYLHLGTRHGACAGPVRLVLLQFDK